MKYIISETGEFPPQYKVLQEGENGIWIPVFGPDPDLEDAQRQPCLLYTSPSPRDGLLSRMPSSA